MQGVVPLLKITVRQPIPLDGLPVHQPDHAKLITVPSAQVQA